MCPARRRTSARVTKSTPVGPKKVEKREAPKAELGFPADIQLNFARPVFREESEITIKLSKSFQESPPKEYPALFEEKCKQCCIVCDFRSPNADARAKETKTRLLKHLAFGFTIPHLVRTITAKSIQLFYSMLSVNLFRAAPTIPKKFLIDDHISFSDESWVHVSLVYDALLASFNCPITTSLTPEFLYQLIGNAFSLDERERIAVRDILHSLYTKFMNHRTIVREKIAAHFANGSCSAELLQFFLSVVSGFNSPLNPEHVTFFHRSILPLYELPNMPRFAAALLDLVVKYVTKSAYLLEPTVSFLLKHWPKAHRAKQGLFLKALETLLVTFEINVTSQMAVNVFRMIGVSIGNENSDVADIAIDIVMNPRLGFMLKANASQVFPLLMGPAYQTSQKHWDECIRANAFVSLQALSELDQSTFMRITDANKGTEAQQSARGGASKANWMKVFDAVKRVDHNFQPPPLEVLQ